MLQCGTHVLICVCSRCFSLQMLLQSILGAFPGSTEKRASVTPSPMDCSAMSTMFVAAKVQLSAGWVGGFSASGLMQVSLGLVKTNYRSIMSLSLCSAFYGGQLEAQNSAFCIFLLDSAPVVFSHARSGFLHVAFLRGSVLREGHVQVLTVVVHCLPLLPSVPIQA